MNILVFSDNVWDDTNSLGNTLSNFFYGDTWKNDKFYNIYMRSAMPDNRVCNNYFQIEPISLIKNYIDYERIGINHNNILKENNKQGINEKRIIDLIHKYSINIIYPIMDFVYRKEKWNNINFKKYIKEANPDIFFAFVTNFAILNKIVNYVKLYSNAKIVLFIADDVYNDINTKAIYRRKKLRHEFSNIIKNSDKIYGISKELCEEYSTRFNVKIDILSKGCFFENPVKEKNNKIISFVYAGNLLYGRDDILQIIGKTIQKSNNTSKQKAILEIYTNTTLTNKIKKKLNINNSSILMGKKNYEDIKKIMNKADYNLQVESFERKQIKSVRYSFSTKIIDCLQSGSSFIAIGPNETSSIKYLEGVPGVHVIDNKSDIEREIANSIKFSNNIISDSIKIRNYAIEKHDIYKNQVKLKNDFIEIINK